MTQPKGTYSVSTIELFKTFLLKHNIINKYIECAETFLFTELYPDIIDIYDDDGVFIHFFPEKKTAIIKYPIIIIQMIIHGDGTCYEPQSENINILFQYDINDEKMFESFIKGYDNYCNQVIEKCSHHYNIINFMEYFNLIIEDGIYYCEVYADK